MEKKENVKAKNVKVKKEIKANSNEPVLKYYEQHEIELISTLSSLLNDFKQTII